MACTHAHACARKKHACAQELVPCADHEGINVGMILKDLHQCLAHKQGNFCYADIVAEVQMTSF